MKMKYIYGVCVFTSKTACICIKSGTSDAYPDSGLNVMINFENMTSEKESETRVHWINKFKWIRFGGTGTNQSFSFGFSTLQCANCQLSSILKLFFFHLGFSFRLKKGERREYKLTVISFLSALLFSSSIYRYSQCFGRTLW